MLVKFNIRAKSVSDGERISQSHLNNLII